MVDNLRYGIQYGFRCHYCNNSYLDETGMQARKRKVNVDEYIYSLNHKAIHYFT